MFPQDHSDFPIKRKQQYTLHEHPNNVTCDSYRCAQVTHHRQGLSQDCPPKYEEVVVIPNNTHSPIDPNPEMNRADITPPLALLPPKATPHRRHRQDPGYYPLDRLGESNIRLRRWQDKEYICSSRKLTQITVISL